MNVFAGQQLALQEARTSRSSYDPINNSLLGEYARLVLLSTTVCTAIIWATRVSTGLPAFVMIATCLVSLATLLSNRFAGLVRLVVLLSVGVGLAAVAQADGQWLSPLPFFSPVAMLSCVAFLAMREVVMVIGRGGMNGLMRAVTVVIVAGSALVYLLLWPESDGFSSHQKDLPEGFVVEKMSFWELLRVRSAKLFVFSLFAYLGACVGSFLNVVASSLPRGESIALRSSACPKCGTEIRRIDNLPIMSYLALQGRCRACKVQIPVRYFAVEVVVGTIFSSLFLYELVTGAANVPSFQHYHFAGILWIILYAKWPVIGIYFYHVFMFSCLVVFALMETDRLRCSRRASITLIGLFAAFAVVAPTLLPVAFDEFLPTKIADSLPPIAVRAISCVVGGIVGWMIALGSRRLGIGTSSPVPFVLLGVSLGWQATVTIAFFWIVASLVWNAMTKRGRSSRFRQTALQARFAIGPTAVLFTVAMAHHPLWKWLTRFW